MIGDVLARHQRRVHERLERLGRAVGVHRAEKAAAGVDRAGQLEGFGSAHLPDDDPVGPHREDELHQVAQRDLAGAVERRRPDLVVRAVDERNGELANLLARPDAVVRGRCREQRAEQRGLACSRLARDDDPAADLHERAEERRRRRAQRLPPDQLVEGDVADRVAPQRGREAIGDGCDRRREPRRTLQHTRLDQRVLRAEVPIGRGEQPVDNAPVLLLGCRRRQAAKMSVGIEVRDPTSFDEHLFDVGAGEELGQRAEVGDGADHAPPSPRAHRAGGSSRGARRVRSRRRPHGLRGARRRGRDRVAGAALRCTSAARRIVSYAPWSSVTRECATGGKRRDRGSRKRAGGMRVARDPTRLRRRASVGAGTKASVYGLDAGEDLGSDLAPAVRARGSAVHDDVQLGVGRVRQDVGEPRDEARDADRRWLTRHPRAHRLRSSPRARRVPAPGRFRPTRRCRRQPARTRREGTHDRSTSGART